ncbi:MAG: hypothetical protein AB1649_01790 [Chloroflexota bacterium]
MGSSNEPENGHPTGGRATALLVTLPFTMGVTALIYYDFRIRKGGFDILTMAKEVRAPAIYNSPDIKR